MSLLRVYGNHILSDMFIKFSISLISKLNKSFISSSIFKALDHFMVFLFVLRGILAESEAKLEINF